jgi:hypothetical protein
MIQEPGRVIAGFQGPLAAKALLPLFQIVLISRGLPSTPFENYALFLMRIVGLEASPTSVVGKEAMRAASPPEVCRPGECPSWGSCFEFVNSVNLPAPLGPALILILLLLGSCFTQVHQTVCLI